jgi:hypothetical protein
MADRLNMTSIVNPAEVLAVVETLADTAYDYQSPDGISDHTGIEVEDVAVILDAYGHLFRVPTAPIHGGRELYTLACRPPGWREHYTIVRAFLAKIAI